MRATRSFKSGRKGAARAGYSKRFGGWNRSFALLQWLHWSFQMGFGTTGRSTEMVQHLPEAEEGSVEDHWASPFPYTPPSTPPTPPGATQASATKQMLMETLLVKERGENPL